MVTDPLLPASGLPLHCLLAPFLKQKHQLCVRYLVCVTASRYNVQVQHQLCAQGNIAGDTGGCGWSHGVALSVAVGFRERESGGQRWGGKEEESWGASAQRDRKRQRVQREMLRGFLPGALTAGKPDELFFRLSSEGSITLSVCLSVCLVQGIELSTLHVLTKCYNLSYNLCSSAFLLSFKVRCFAHRA